VLIFFHLKSDHDQTPYAALYSLEPFTGPNTGIDCDDIHDWVSELGLDMDEQIDTGGLNRALRSARDSGVVVLEWRAY
jgi:hypothetical protein